MAVVNFKHFQFTKLEQVFWQYKVGALFEYELVQVLAEWEYEPVRVSQDLGHFLEPSPGSWMELASAVDDGLISGDTYRAIYDERRRLFRCREEQDVDDELKLRARMDEWKQKIAALRLMWGGG